jgi:uncharacterized protein (TIGR03083 family)
MSESAAGKPRVDLDNFDLGVQYGLARMRLSELLAGVVNPAEVAVPACPSWSVHDVLAHLVAVNEDVLAGKLTGPPSDEDTAAQVARRRGVPTPDVIEEWAEMAPPLEKLLTEVRVWPGFLDVLAHEHDIRGAIGNTDGRDGDEMWAAGEYLVTNWRPPVQLVVSFGDSEHLVGGAKDSEDAEGADKTGDASEEAILVLETTPFEAFRFRLGRRSRDQLSKLAWTGDPGPVLDTMTIFGPEPYDLVE